MPASTARPTIAICARSTALSASFPPELAGPPPNPWPVIWRRWMRTLLRTKRRRRRCGYTQRWQVETVNSMFKRNLSDELFSRSYQAQCREMRLLVLTHNVMILLLWIEVFDGALLTPLLLRYAWDDDPTSGPPPGDPAFIVSFPPWYLSFFPLLSVPIKTDCVGLLINCDHSNIS